MSSLLVCFILVEWRGGVVPEPQLNVLSMSVSSGKIIVRKTMNQEILKRHNDLCLYIRVCFLHSAILSTYQLILIFMLHVVGGVRYVAHQKH